MKYILSKTTAAASSSPLLSRRTKSASGPDHPHFATVRVVSSSVASLSLSPADFLLMKSNRKTVQQYRVQNRNQKKNTSKYYQYFVYTSYSSTNQKSSTTAVPYDTEFRIQISKIYLVVRYEVWHSSSTVQELRETKCLTDAEKHISCTGSIQTDSPRAHHKAKFLQATVPRFLLFLTGHDHFGEHGRKTHQL